LADLAEAEDSVAVAQDEAGEGETMTDPKKAASDLVRELAATFGGELRSAVLYGSVARGEYVDGVSNINVLVLFDDIAPATLQRASPLARRWADDGLVPLLLERAEWESAADVFAIEVLDMVEAREVLHGGDPVSGLDVSHGALRLQAEHELRGKLITLHNGMLRAAESPESMGTLLAMALPSMLTYLRAALRLVGKQVPRTSGAVIDVASEVIGFDPAGFQAALDARRARGKWKVAITDAAVDRYHTAAERTASFVDRIGR
jgi:predicted nucleotidyltransferase